MNNRAIALEQPPDKVTFRPTLKWVTAVDLENVL